MADPVEIAALSKTTLALLGKVLATTQTHAELDHLFMLFDIQDLAEPGSSKMKRATTAMNAAAKDPTLLKQMLPLALYMVHTLDLAAKRERGELAGDLRGLLTSLERDGILRNDGTGNERSGYEPLGQDVTQSIHPARPAVPTSRTAKPNSSYEYDLFISHASEDKDTFVRPLAEHLEGRGIRVWYDEFSLDIGDSLRESIDFGLGSSRYGVVVLSHSFFGKEWPRKELNGLMALERNGRKVILPVWLQVSEDEVRKFSPILADRVAARSTDGPEGVAAALDRLLDRLPKGEDRTAAGRALGLKAGPRFVSHIRAPNAKAYAAVIIGGVPEEAAPLNDDAHDAIGAVFAKLEPTAQCERQTDTYAFWTLFGPDKVSAQWIGEVFQGPVIVLTRAMTLTGGASEASISLSELVEWWRDAISAARSLLRELGVTQVAIGLSFNPYPSGGPNVTGVSFGDLPPGQRIASAHMVPPWDFQSSVTTPDRMIDDVTGAAASLLKLYSYRRLDATLAAIRGRLSPVEKGHSKEVNETLAEMAPQGDEPMNSADEPIRLVRIIADEVSAPRFDGTAGSALYRIPFELSRRPSARWSERFIEAWNHPPRFTTMHRPGIASVVDDRIILDSTSLEEVRQYHRDTLMLAVDIANKQFAAETDSEIEAEARRSERLRQHQEEVLRAATEITFD
ncbi:MAG TPA: toll/interleukin-1 receptor domain-containing protein [Candidatus Angelobacter sp.]|nr:toll/interleukin-1 receptor domain-containing protein [Candidatus Angelobacter sp.]